MKLVFLSLASILIAIALWLVQDLMRYALSEQYREFGYIGYGSFLRISGIIPRLGIIWCPLFGSFLIFLKYGKLAFKRLPMGDDRMLICLLLVCLFLEYLFEQIQIGTPSG